jgi:hypothetical protein
MQRFSTVEYKYIPPIVWRRGREVEGTPLLREHTGLNLYQGFESLRLRQLCRQALEYKGFFIVLGDCPHFNLRDRAQYRDDRPVAPDA